MSGEDLCVYRKKHLVCICASFLFFFDFLESLFVKETGINVCVTIEALKFIIYSL